MIVHADVAQSAERRAASAKVAGSTPAVGSIPEIVFDPAKHTYHVNGVQVPSVTQILGVLNKPALPWWGMRTGVEGVCQLRSYEILGSLEIPWGDPEGVVKMLTEHKLTVNHVKSQAATRGTSIHKALEAYMRDETVPNVADFPQQDRGYVQALASALLKLDLRVIEAEQVVASVEHGYAGTFDALVESPALRDARHGVVRLDLKTGKRLYPVTHFPQLEAYEHAAVECGHRSSDTRAILLLTEDGAWSFHPSRATFEDFLGIKAAYDAVQRIKGRK